MRGTCDPRKGAGVSDTITIRYADASAVQKLQALWHAFCDADPVPLEFIDDMEKAGFVELRSVEDADLDEAFAAERGIEAGGLLWELTDAGRRALAEAEGK